MKPATIAITYNRLLAVMVDHHSGPVPSKDCIALAGLFAYAPRFYSDHGQPFVEFYFADGSTVTIGLEE